MRSAYATAEIRAEAQRESTDQKNTMTYATAEIRAEAQLGTRVPTREVPNAITEI